MDKTQQRIKIAEACGWQIQHDGPGGGYCGLHPKKHSPDDSPCPLPDYLNDLNAMHEAEKVLTGENKVRYFGDSHYPSKLIEVCKRWDVALGATAEQRAEAFLRTLNLWEANNG